MSDRLQPRDPADVRQIVEWALAGNHRLAIEGRGSKRPMGRSHQGAQLVSMAACNGIIEYQPEELVLTAHAGTRIAEIDALLAQRNQMLAFEPPDMGAILGGVPQDATLGGTIACNLAGPRRISAGAARDHFLGFQATNGRAERFKSGGKVMKNVTGYDLSKLLAGSRGTLAILDEISVKVLPAPECTATLLVAGLADAAGVSMLCRAMGSAHDVSGAAHLPAVAAARSSVEAIRRSGTAVTALRLEGVTPSVKARLEALRSELGAGREYAHLETLESLMFWREVRDVRALWQPAAATDHGRELWRLSVAPASGAAIVASMAGRFPGAEVLYDWSGGLIWMSLPADPTNAVALRAAVDGGRATPIVGVRSAAADGAATASGLDALARRIRESFDPNGIFV